MDEKTLPGGSHGLTAREGGPAGPGERRSCSQEQDFPAPRAGHCPQGASTGSSSVPAQSQGRAGWRSPAPAHRRRGDVNTQLRLWVNSGGGARIFLLTIILVNREKVGFIGAFRRTSASMNK